MTNVAVRADDRRLYSKRSDVGYWSEKCDECRQKIANLLTSTTEAASKTKEAEKALQPLAVAAYGEADQNALRKLSGLRRELADARLDQEAREIALRHVQDQLAEHEAKLVEAKRNVYVRDLADLAEKR